MTKNWNEMTRDERLAEVDACWTQVDTREPLPENCHVIGRLPENWTDKDAMEDSEIVLYPSTKVIKNYNNMSENLRLMYHRLGWTKAEMLLWSAV